ncbi:hypothetical protein LNKW23_04300 [Paralimibaculum aggregatum]|uniref:VPLPA-CTERM sorting domain-containing protein n=1 Tax=Paralimibaculum aggregatum TaxID=3036245 RepID=A0ABQ6LKA1_9RHOB|nr:VPLPA-CTERM sorting domain-containing protein [Limibaculum sp. NKW23]GMG81218.1 hypothetical protein LNKW23_04300 [Limibaculum sp. NKW23]
MSRFIPAAAALAVGLAAGPAGATVTYFNDEAAFDAATAGIGFVLDPFDNGIAAADSITLDSGVVSENMGGSRGSFDNTVTGGIYLNAVDGNGTNASLSVVWTFPIPVTAVGLQYLGLFADEVSVTVDGSLRALRESADGDPEDGFFGFTTTTPVTSITFTTQHPALYDTYGFDDLAFGAASAEVPLPAGLPLLLAGLGALGLAARRRVTS